LHVSQSQLQFPFARGAEEALETGLRDQQLEEEVKRSSESERVESAESPLPCVCPRIPAAMSRISKQRWRSSMKRRSDALGRPDSMRFSDDSAAGVSCAASPRSSLAIFASIAVRNRGMADRPVTYASSAAMMNGASVSAVPDTTERPIAPKKSSRFHG
jgi:hypothetical protein